MFGHVSLTGPVNPAGPKLSPSHSYSDWSGVNTWPSSGHCGQRTTAGPLWKSLSSISRTAPLQKALSLLWGLWLCWLEGKKGQSHFALIKAAASGQNQNTKQHMAARVTETVRAVKSKRPWSWISGLCSATMKTCHSLRYCTEALTGLFKMLECAGYFCASQDFSMTFFIHCESSRMEQPFKTLAEAFLLWQGLSWHWCSTEWEMLI